MQCSRVKVAARWGPVFHPINFIASVSNPMRGQKNMGLDGIGLNWIGLDSTLVIRSAPARCAAGNAASRRKKTNGMGRIGLTASQPV